MYEVELKLESDHETVRPRLVSLGAEPRNRVQQVDRYFDAPHRTFAETNEALRVREQESAQQTTPELTDKGPLVEDASKTREELTAAMTDPDATTAILEALGFEHSVTVRKQRERFDFEVFTITLNLVDQLGQFLELETEAEIEPARERAVELDQTLGLDASDQIRKSYFELTLADAE